jgi:hypothetical protein
VQTPEHHTRVSPPYALWRCTCMVPCLSQGWQPPAVRSRRYSHLSVLFIDFGRHKLCLLLAWRLGHYPPAHDCCQLHAGCLPTSPCKLAMDVPQHGLSCTASARSSVDSCGAHLPHKRQVLPGSVQRLQCLTLRKSRAADVQMMFLCTNCTAVDDMAAISACQAGRVYGVKLIVARLPV